VTTSDDKWRIEREKRMIASLCSCLGIIVACFFAGSAYAGDSFDRAWFDAFQDRDVIVRVVGADGRSFRPIQLVVLHDTGAWYAALPRYAAARNDNRLDLSRTGRFSHLFDDRPFSTFATPENRIGDLRRAGATLIADLRGDDWRADTLGRLTANSVTLLTKPPNLNEPVSISLRPRFREAQSVNANEIGPVIGGVYRTNKGLLLSPPYPFFYGAKLF
jgi:hypothetical protein